MLRLILCLWGFMALPAMAQIHNPVTVTHTLHHTTGNAAELLFTCTIQAGWHITPTLEMDEVVGATLTETLTTVSSDDDDDTLTEHRITLRQNVVFTDTIYALKGALTYVACSQEQCLLPERIPFTYSSAELSAAPITNSSSTEISHSSWLTVFGLGFLGGLLALLTPCVWPIVPLTVSLFMKRNKRRGQAVWDALCYGGTIIAIFLLLGTVATLLFGANAVNVWATNAVVNCTLAVILIGFGASLIGVFQLSLPHTWATAVDRAADRATGWWSVALTAFALVISSFSCTAPIVGFLLVELWVEGQLIAPLVGMFGFSLALAMAFALLALFPTWLKSLPKSGRWLQAVKVSLGVMEIAFAFKFLSVADMAYGWNLLSRTTFLVVWVVLFAALGVYLLRCHRIAAVLVWCFVVYLSAGLWGAPLHAIAAFLPQQTANSTVNKQFNIYEETLQRAREEEKPVLVEFTGWGCVNCRKMEASVLAHPEVAAKIGKDYLHIALYVDDRTPLPTPITTMEQGKEVTLYTMGDKWSHLQRNGFGANAQPFFVILRPDGTQRGAAYGYSERIEGFLNFLQTEE